MLINNCKNRSPAAHLRWFLGAFSVYCITAMPLGFAAIEDDSDGDGILDVVDNCTKVANSNQRDTDGDGFGNICDGDLDNNGIVNSLDYSAFKARLFSRDANADLNGDGIVNSIDFTLFKRLLLKAPGPGNPSEATFVDAPPPVTDVQIFKLEQPVQERNAALAASFSQVTGLKPVISFNFENSTVGLNDLGLEPDAKAGDGIYSGYLNHNFEAEDKTAANFQQRLSSSETKQPVLFSGRDVIGRSAQPFVEPAIQADTRALPIKTSVSASLVLQPLDLVPILPVAHDAARSLMITHRNVVADPTRTFDPCDVDGDNNQGNVNGAWSFKTLMTNMANTAVSGISAQEFTHNWINKWMSNQSVNGFTINARPNFQNFFPGWNPANPATLNMNRLPFRLLAIVNRMDLAVSSPYNGVGGQPGETRLVFGLIDLSSCPAHNISPTREMTVIFEYGDPSSACTSLKNRANDWIHLSTLPIGTAAYNTALQALTDDVTL
ncbi:MAG TPA: dockerin type I domain-containing protein, partial [Cellvibrionaceae bacterium]|nr:dockerin type I domain-containing protein [Cellvibrionaceae bacterium]